MAGCASPVPVTGGVARSTPIEIGDSGLDMPDAGPPKEDEPDDVGDLFAELIED